RDIEEVLRDMKGAGAPGEGSKRLDTPSPGPSGHPLPEGEGPVSTFADNFKQRVEEKSATTAIYVQNAERVERTGDTIQIVLTNPAQLSMLQSREHKTVLDAVAAELVGKAVSVSLIMKEQKAGAVLENVKEEPLVKRFLEVFRGDLAQVKPAKGEQS